jgi:hypothetical protein
MLLDRGFRQTGQALHSSHPAGRFLDTLLHILKGHAWSQRDIDVRALKEGLTNHRNFRRVRQVEDRNECALSVLNEAVEGFRLEGFLDPIECLCCSAAAENFVSGLSVSRIALSNIRMTTSR